MRCLIAICCLLILSTQLRSQTPQQTQGKMRWSLVYLGATAETVNGVPLESTGTGFIVTSQGRILTTYHLIGKLKRLADSPNQGDLNWSSLEITTGQEQGLVRS
jgi:S1-C subfamily serine protease